MKKDLLPILACPVQRRSGTKRYGPGILPVPHVKRVMKLARASPTCCLRTGQQISRINEGSHLVRYWEMTVRGMQT